MRPKVATVLDWEVLAATSHSQTAIAIREKLQHQELRGGTMHGLEELMDALTRADKRALESHLIRVMQHVITWKMQPGNWGQVLRDHIRLVYCAL